MRSADVGGVVSRSLVSVSLLSMMLAASFGTSGALASGGSGVNVRPLRIDLSNDQRGSSITVDNGQTAPEIMRVEVDAWDQSSGGDRYVRSTDLLVVPPVLDIAPQRGRVVEVGIHRRVDDGAVAVIAFADAPPDGLADGDEVADAPGRVAVPIAEGAEQPVA